MSTLPDLDPNTAGHVAFYNAVKQGGLTPEMMTWSDVIDNQNINSYNTYDNGLIVKYDDDAWGNITIRLKTDGWVVAYTGWDGGIDGYIGASPHQIGKFEKFGSQEVVAGKSATNGRLAQAMEDMLTDLSDWPNQVVGSFSRSDIGLYDFAYGSDGISLFSLSEYDFNIRADYTRTVSELPGTVAHIAAAGGYISRNGTLTEPTFIKIEGNNISDPEMQDITNLLSSSGSVDVRLSVDSGGDGWGSGLIVVAVNWSEE